MPHVWHHIFEWYKISHFQQRRIRAIRPYLNADTASMLVHAFVSSHIDYCNSLLFGVPVYSLQKLQHLLNCAARVITGITYKHDPDSLHLLFTLHWLPVKYRIRYKLAVMVHNCRSGHAPKYLRDMISDYVPGKDLRSKEELLLKPHSCRTEMGKRSFSYSAPFIWKSLSLSLRATTDIVKFKNILFCRSFQKLPINLIMI